MVLWGQSQSPQIGADVITPLMKRVPCGTRFSRNPLKSGLMSSPHQSETRGEILPSSQSPQIGADVITRTTGN